jgi:hypothetical protein
MKKIVSIIEKIKSPVVEGNNVEWEDGSLGGINLPFLLLDDDVDIFDVVTEEVIALDKKNSFPKFNMEKVNEVYCTQNELCPDCRTPLMEYNSLEEIWGSRQVAERYMCCPNCG